MEQGEEERGGADGGCGDGSGGGGGRGGGESWPKLSECHNGGSVSHECRIKDYVGQ